MTSKTRIDKIEKKLIKSDSEFNNPYVPDRVWHDLHKVYGDRNSPLSPSAHVKVSKQEFDAMVKIAVDRVYGKKID